MKICKLRSNILDYYNNKYCISTNLVSIRTYLRSNHIYIYIYSRRESSIGILISLSTLEYDRHSLLNQQTSCLVILQDCVTRPFGFLEGDSCLGLAGAGAGCGSSTAFFGLAGAAAGCGSSTAGLARSDWFSRCNRKISSSFIANNFSYSSCEHSH